MDAANRATDALTAEPARKIHARYKDTKGGLAVSLALR
jgi:hypothetical protein